MALQSSGTIKFSEIQTEFGGTNPISLSEYYSAATGIPSSGPISMSDFYSGTSYTPHTVELLPLLLTATGESAEDPFIFAQTLPCTVTVTGGTAPYQYSWSQLSGDIGINILTRYDASTIFSATVLPGVTLSGVFTCTVTDDTGLAVVPPANVGVSISNTTVA